MVLHYCCLHSKGSAAQYYKRKTRASIGSHLPGWQTTTDKKSAYFDPEKDVLWMKKRQGKIRPIDSTARVSSYFGSQQQQAIDGTLVQSNSQLLLHPKAKTTGWEESINI